MTKSTDKSFEDGVSKVQIREAKTINFGMNDNLPETIKKSHELVFSRQNLSSHEQNIFNIMAAHMKVEHWNDNKAPVYEFPASNLSEWLNISPRHLGSTLAPAADRLAKRTVGFINDENGEFDFIPLFSRLKYRNARLVLTPNPELKSQYIDYSGGFALINTNTILKLKKNYSKRLYEIISRFKDLGYKQRPLKIDEIKGYFGLFDDNGNYLAGKKSLAVNSVFIKRCIEESFAEIEKVCKDELILFEDEDGNKGFSLIKKGRNTIGLSFSYRWLNQQEQMDEDSARRSIRELENKRLLSKEILTINELNLLAEAYLILNVREKAISIFSAIQKRINESGQSSTPFQQEAAPEALDDNDNFLNKIRQMESLNPDAAY